MKSALGIKSKSKLSFFGFDNLSAWQCSDRFYARRCAPPTKLAWFLANLWAKQNLFFIS
jgi:hypothetical protein